MGAVVRLPFVCAASLHLAERGEPAARVAFENIQDSLMVRLVVCYEYRLHFCQDLLVDNCAAFALRIFRRLLRTPLPANTQ